MKTAYGLRSTACIICLFMVASAVPCMAGVWSPMSYSGTETLKAVWGTSGSDIFAVGSDGTILHYNGSLWSKMASNTSKNLQAVWGSSATSVLAVGDDGTIYQYNGTSWINRSAGTPYNLNAIWGASESEIFIVGESGFVFKCEGTACTNISAITPYALYGVWGTSASDVYAVGGNGTILHYDGSEWSAMASPTTENLYAISGLGASDMLAVGAGGTILRYDGSSWKSMVAATKKDFYCVAFVGSAYALLGGVEGKLFRYNGATWSEDQSPTAYLVQGMWAGPSHDVLAVGYKGTILINRNLPPTASFSVVPSTGIVNETEFAFDAAACQDAEDKAADLQIRWDWEHDGTWDTAYTTVKTASHVYAATDNYTVAVEVIDSGGLAGMQTQQITVATSTSPTALFSVEPDNIYPGTEITVDASASFDSQDAVEELQVRWDWENDGTWDTQYANEKTATHQYSEAGTYLIRLEVKDTDGLTASALQEVNVRALCLAASVLGAEDRRLDDLRRFRDQVLAATPAGRVLIQLYYDHEDEIADMLATRPALAAQARCLMEGLLALLP